MKQTTHKPAQQLTVELHKQYKRGKAGEAERRAAAMKILSDPALSSEIVHNYLTRRGYVVKTDDPADLRKWLTEKQIIKYLALAKEQQREAVKLFKQALKKYAPPSVQELFKQGEL